MNNIQLALLLTEYRDRLSLALGNLDQVLPAAMREVRMHAFGESYTAPCLDELGELEKSLTEAIRTLKAASGGEQ